MSAIREIKLPLQKNFMNLISLDIEATDSGEILELSIFQYEDAKEIYHSYFKPIHSDN